MKIQKHRVEPWAILVLLGGGLAAAAPVIAQSAEQGSNASNNKKVLPPSIAEAAIRAAANDVKVRAFYEKAGWRAFWSEDSGRALEHALANRAGHGLDHVVFLEGAGGGSDPAQREVALTHAAIRYAGALASGLLDPSELHQVYTIPRPDRDLSEELVRALNQETLEQWLTSLAPQDEEYARLSRAYISVRDEARGSEVPALDLTATIHPGDSDIRIPAIVQRLTEGEYLAPADAPIRNTGADSDSAPAAYAPGIVAAVEQLQRDFGIAADGIIGPNTFEVLNLRPGDRAQALAVALERRRWLSRTPSATRIDVNIASAQLRYYRDGNLVDSRKVIVGKPGNETPSLLAPMYRLVANPTWTIPRSIQRGEMAGVSNAYLRNHNMVRRNGWIVQRSGPSNALGLVKFDMQNDRAIYLHDTSAPGLFDRSQRHLSHGCVRVHDALGFASILAADQGVTDKWEAASAAGDQTFVPLPRAIPVRLLYQNVFIDEAGSIGFRTDPYAWNAPIAKALGFANGPNAKAHAEHIDVGP